MTSGGSGDALRLVDAETLSSAAVTTNTNVDPLTGVAVDRLGRIYWSTADTYDVHVTIEDDARLHARAPTGGLLHLDVMGDELVGYHSDQTGEGAVVALRGDSWEPLFAPPVGRVVTDMAGSLGGHLVIETGPIGGGPAEFLVRWGSEEYVITPPERLAGGPVFLGAERAILYEDHDSGGVVRYDLANGTSSTVLRTEAFAIRADHTGRRLAWAEAASIFGDSRVCITSLP